MTETDKLRSILHDTAEVAEPPDDFRSIEQSAGARRHRQRRVRSALLVSAVLILGAGGAAMLRAQDSPRGQRQVTAAGPESAPVTAPTGYVPGSLIATADGVAGLASTGDLGELVLWESTDGTRWHQRALGFTGAPWDPEDEFSGTPLVTDHAMAALDDGSLGFLNVQELVTGTPGSWTRTALPDGARINGVLTFHNRFVVYGSTLRSNDGAYIGHLWVLDESTWRRIDPPAAQLGRMVISSQGEISGRGGDFMGSWSTGDTLTLVGTSHDGEFRSWRTNDLEIWRRAEVGTFGGDGLHTAPIDDNTALAVTLSANDNEHSEIRRLHWGPTSSEPSGPIGALPNNVDGLAALPGNSGFVAITTLPGKSGPVVWLSADGTRWNRSTDGTPAQTESHGPSQSEAEAARDHVIPAVAALPYAQRVDVMWSVLTNEGRWIISRLGSDIDAPNCVLGNAHGEYGRDFVCTPEYGELLLVKPDRDEIIRAYPLPGYPPYELAVTDDAVFCGRQGDGALSTSMLCRVDRDTLELTGRVFPFDGPDGDAHPAVPPEGDWGIDPPSDRTGFDQLTTGEGSVRTRSFTIDPVTLEPTPI